MSIQSRDRQLIALVDALTGEAAHKAGSQLACHPGCTPCCFGPFGITSLDARRLQWGLQDLAAVDSAKASAIRSRAKADVKRQAAASPDGTIGTFSTPSEEEAFYEKFASDPCPVLNPDTGRCDLYAWRPICCRTYGPPVRIGEDDLPPCPLCFKRATPNEVEAARQEIDVEREEFPLIVRIDEQAGTWGLTTIAFAIESQGS